MRLNYFCSALVSLFCAGLLFIACAQKALEQDLAAKVTTQPTLSSNQELQNEATFIIENAKVSVAQRAQLKELQAKTSTQLQAYRDESLKLRAILIKDVFSKKYNRPEVKLIQSKIEKVEHKRVALIFSTIDKANTIFGRETDAQESARVMDRFMLPSETR